MGQLQFVQLKLNNNYIAFRQLQLLIFGCQCLTNNNNVDFYTSGSITITITVSNFNKITITYRFSYDTEQLLLKFAPSAHGNVVFLQVKNMTHY